jgi:hypothetical protein
MSGIGVTELIVIAVVLGILALIVVGAAMFMLNAQTRRNRRDE